MIFQLLDSLLSRMRRVLAVHQARGRDPDLEQAILRVGLGGLILAYAASRLFVAPQGSVAGLWLACAVMGTHFMFGAWQVWYLRVTRKPTPRLRVAGIVMDMSAATIGMASTGEFGVPLVGMYLFVTVGNGFRFGPRYLLIAYWLSILGFSSLLVVNDFWAMHRAIGIGLLLTLAVVPLYVLVLLTRLTAQKDAAEQLSNAKSRFVANVSHELRTPLTGIFAVYELFQQRRLPPDERELVGMLGNAMASLKASVDAVLQMSKLEAGAEKANNQPFNLPYFLQQLAVHARTQAVAKRLAWRLVLDASVPPTLIADPDHLGHVLGNLINNAFKFTHEGSVELRVAQRDDRIRFEVVDTGIGIPAAIQERLFDRFVQVDSSATRRYGGTGLGTSIARDLTELMGGRIGVVSEPGNGSTFWVELPLATPRGDEPMPPAHGFVRIEASSDAARMRLSDLLGRIGLQIEEEGPFRSAAARVPTNAFARVIAMPYAEAVACARRVDAISEPSLCPTIVVLTEGSVVPGAIERLYEHGVVAVTSMESVTTTLPTIVGGLAHRASQRDTALEVDAERRNAYAARPLRIVLADDNQSNRLLIARMLENAGHVVVQADRADAAYEAIGQDDVDLAILDLNMPDMSGPDVVKLQRAGESGGRKLPIIILSADATPAARVHSLEAGANEYLTKPISSGQLLSTIERTMAGAAAREELPQARTPHGVDTARGADRQGAEPASDSPVRGEPLLDAERLAALRRVARGDDNFLVRYLAASLQDLDAAMAQLRAAVPNGHVRQVKDALHAIEGTAASLGADSMLDGCRLLREWLIAGQQDGVSHAFAELSARYALTKSALRATVQLEGNSVSGASGERRQ